MRGLTGSIVTARPASQTQISLRAKWGLIK